MLACHAGGPGSIPGRCILFFRGQIEKFEYLISLSSLVIIFGNNRNFSRNYFLHFRIIINIICFFKYDDNPAATTRRLFVIYNRTCYWCWREAKKNEGDHNKIILKHQMTNKVLVSTQRGPDGFVGD